MDPGVEESVNIIIFAAPRVEIKELADVRDQFSVKFGKDYCKQIQDNVGNRKIIEINGLGVNPRVVHNLAISAIDKSLVSGYLNNIAEHYEIDYIETSETSKPLEEIAHLSHFIGDANKSHYPLMQGAPVHPPTQENQTGIFQTMPPYNALPKKFDEVIVPPKTFGEIALPPTEKVVPSAPAISQYSFHRNSTEVF
jgi:vacuolar protein sorting-associated protein IST1